jgi:hypothetical protein
MKRAASTKVEAATSKERLEREQIAAAIVRLG